MNPISLKISKFKFIFENNEYNFEYNILDFFKNKEIIKNKINYNESIIYNIRIDTLDDKFKFKINCDPRNENSLYSKSNIKFKLNDNDKNKYDLTLNILPLFNSLIYKILNKEFFIESYDIKLNKKDKYFEIRPIEFKKVKTLQYFIKPKKSQKKKNFYYNYNIKSNLLSKIINLLKNDLNINFVEWKIEENTNTINIETIPQNMDDDLSKIELQELQEQHHENIKEEINDQEIIFEITDINNKDDINVLREEINQEKINELSINEEFIISNGNNEINIDNYSTPSFFFITTSSRFLKLYFEESDIYQSMKKHQLNPIVIFLLESNDHYSFQSVPEDCYVLKIKSNEKDFLADDQTIISLNKIYELANIKEEEEKYKVNLINKKPSLKSFNIQISEWDLKFEEVKFEFVENNKFIKAYKLIFKIKNEGNGSFSNLYFKLNNKSYYNYFNIQGSNQDINEIKFIVSEEFNNNINITICKEDIEYNTYNININEIEKKISKSRFLSFFGV